MAPSLSAVEVEAFARIGRTKPEQARRRAAITASVDLQGLWVDPHGRLAAHLLFELERRGLAERPSGGGWTPQAVLDTIIRLAPTLVLKAPPRQPRKLPAGVHDWPKRRTPAMLTWLHGCPVDRERRCAVTLWDAARIVAGVRTSGPRLQGRFSNLGGDPRGWMMFNQAARRCPALADSVLRDGRRYDNLPRHPRTHRRITINQLATFAADSYRRASANSAADGTAWLRHVAATRLVTLAWELRRAAAG